MNKVNEVSLSKMTETIVRQLFDKLSIAADPVEISNLFSENIDWNIPGYVEMVPWIGKKKGRFGVASFYQQIRELLESVRFEINEILIKENRAVVLGYLESRVKSTGKLMQTEFAFDLTVKREQIVRFRMFEDSFTVSQAISQD